MRILVCGGRDFTDYSLLRDTLIHILYDGDHTDYTVSTIIHGNAKGADKLADKFAKEHGLNVDPYPIPFWHWKAFGKKAGLLRNGKMLRDGKPDLVVAFPGGSGTGHMVSISKKAGVPVTRIERTDEGDV